MTNSRQDEIPKHRIKYEKKKENEGKNKQNLNTLEVQLINNKIKWYGHILRTNKYIIQKMVLNIKPKGKCPRGKPRPR